QVVDTVDRAQRQRRPAMLPRAAWNRVLVEDHEAASYRNAALLEMIRRAQSRLPRADDHDFGLDRHALLRRRAAALVRHAARPLSIGVARSSRLIIISSASRGSASSRMATGGRGCSAVTSAPSARS